MISVERLVKNPTAANTRFIVTSPAELRELANRLEQMANSTHDKEVVECDLTGSITVLYEPEERMDVSAVEGGSVING